MRLAFFFYHVRRRFYELAAAGPAPIASEALAPFGELYTVEAEICGRSAEERRAVRQERNRPVIEALEPWLRARPEAIIPKGKLAEAIRSYDRLKLMDNIAYVLFAIEIIRRSDAQKGFEFLPRRWVVERTFGWMIRWRRLVRDYEDRPMFTKP